MSLSSSALSPLVGLVHNFALSYSTNPSTTSSTGGAGFMPIDFIYFLVGIVVIASFWKLFVKAGKPGWAAIIPFYNYYVALKIAGRPGWWFILLFIPVVNVVIFILFILDFVKAYGQSTGFGVLSIFFSVITLPIMAFGDAKYVGAGGAGAGVSPAGAVPAPAGTFTPPAAIQPIAPVTPVAPDIGAPTPPDPAPAPSPESSPAPTPPSDQPPVSPVQ